MLKGSLQTVALPEVLNFLADTGKSGEFHVSGSRGEGRIWFDQGRMSGLMVDRAQEPSEAIFEMLRIDDGEFDFTADAERPENARAVDGESGAVAPALEAAEAKLAEWRDIVAVVPSLSHRLQLKAETPAGPVTLEPEQWMMVVAVGAGRSVAEVIDAREMQEFDGCKAVRGLVEASLVNVLEPVAEEVEPVVEELEPVASSAEEPDVEVEPVAEDGEPVAVDEPVVDEQVAEPVVEAAVDAHKDDFLSSVVPFGVIASDEPFPVEEEPALEAGSPHDAGVSAFSFGYSSLDGSNGAQEGDHYAALRAAMVEIGDDLTTEEPEAVHAEEAHPVYEFHADPEMDGRAALQALLSEVADEDPHQDRAEDHVDGLADRGPWTEHELSSMDSPTETWDQPVEEASNIVPFAPVHSSDEQPADVAADSEESELAEAEEAAPTEEPINRGLLLKFLSSVRN